MTEISARLPRSRGPIRLAVALAGLALIALGLLAIRPQAHEAASTHAKPAIDTAGTKRGAQALETAAMAAAAEKLQSEFSVAVGRYAAVGVDRPFFTASPDRIAATAARVAQWRRLVVRATRGSGFSPNLVEALVYVESGGRPEAVSGSSAGLTQLPAWTARRYLHLHVNAGRSRRLTRQIANARSYVRARQLQRWRVRYDQRYSAAASIAGTVRFLKLARKQFGRTDLAVAAYQMGLGNVRNVVDGYGAGAPTYAQLYFGTAPDEHWLAWRRLTNVGVVSRDYYWKVLTAERIMRLYRHDRSALSFESRQQARKNSAEEFMHPLYRTHRFANPNAIAAAWKHHVLKAIPRNAGRTHIAMGPFMGEEAHALGRSKRLYRGLRRPTLDVLLYIGKRVHEISGSRKPLIVTSAVRDNRYQSVLMNVNANAARTYSLHTTGYAFDIARSYASRAQANAFQFVLDRLVAVNAVAYIREAAAMHIAVSSDAPRKLKLLARLR
jgi:Transglycosylase SLT domain/Family of unknown function (DUF5715)